MRQKSGTIPINRLSARSETGIFVKHSTDWEQHGTVDFIHRDDYYVLAILLNGSATALADFKEIGCGKCVKACPKELFALKK